MMTVITTMATVKKKTSNLSKTHETRDTLFFFFFLQIVLVYF